MQAVPSLVGTGTAVAAAASGLVFAQSIDEQPRQRPVSALPNWTSTFDSHSRPLRPIPTSRPYAKSVSYAIGAGDTSYSYDSQDGTSAGQLPAHASLPGTSTVPSASSTLLRSAVVSPVGPPRSVSRRHSLIHRADWVSSPGSEVSRDSVSSNGSWMRRLSIRPLSQHGSPRSSIGPDSHSINFSLGSTGPILTPGSVNAPPQQAPRNKLVKRTKAVQDGSSSGSLSRRGSRSQLLTLRRPATSHQRSATLQQTPPVTAGSVVVPPASSSYPKYSFDRLSRTPELDDEVLRGRKEAGSARLLSFFHERVAKTSSSSRGSSPFSSERSSSSSGHPHYPPPARTIQVQRSPASRAFLTKPSTIRALHLGPKHSTAQPTTAGDVKDVVEEQKENTSSLNTPPTRARRSISMHFSSPVSWMPRSGSLRRSKRGSEYSASSNASSSSPKQPSPPDSSGKRHVSAPTPQSPLHSQLQIQVQPRSVTAPTDIRLHRVVDDTGFVPSSRATHRVQDTATRRGSPIPPRSPDSSRLVPGRQRNLSSPLPALSHLSSFNDMSRLGLAISTSEAVLVSAKERENYHSGNAVTYAYTTLPRAFPLVPHSRDASYERPSTVGGSESEFRGFASSGDDDDTDFKSDTIFDSLRTAASARVRTSDTPIESMFDESPPSTAGNSRTKRLSIQEILGQSWDSDTKILEEEDEGASTPMHTANCKSPTPTMLSDHAWNLRGIKSGADGVLAPPLTVMRTDSSLSFAHRMSFARLSLDDDEADEDDEDEDWARIDDSGVTNNLSPPRSQSNSVRGMHKLHATGVDVNSSNRAYLGHRSALAIISGNGSPETDIHHYDGSVGENERLRSSLFDWSESVVQMDKVDADGHSPRPKTVHGKHELDMRGGRPTNRKGPAAAHVRSQSVPAIADPADGTKPVSSKFGTWASSGPKNASEDWDDDFDFETDASNGGDDAFIAFGVGGLGEATGAGKNSSTPFAMVVPASIQATQPTVKAHSGQIRELSLLVNGLKRLCRHARDLNIVSESPALWKEAENIIALASPDEESEVTTPASIAETNEAEARSDDDWSRRTSADFEFSNVDDRFVDDGFDAGTLNSFNDDVFNSPRLSHSPATPPPHEMSRTAVVRERQGMRRRSVFSPEDDIFGGGWPLRDDKAIGVAGQQQQQRQGAEEQHRPHTPEQPAAANETPDNAMIESIMEAMQQQRSASAPIRKSPIKTMSTELFFNTNTLQELVKRANTLFHSLSDLVRRAELLTQSPACTPRHDRYYRREDGSPAFTRVFTDPSSPSKRLPTSQSTNSVLSRASPSVESPASTGISQRLQLMTVN